MNLKQLQINNLLNITQAINNNVPAGELYSMYKSFLSWEMEISQMALFVISEDRSSYQCVTAHGIDDYIFHLDIMPFIHYFDKMKYVYNHENEVISKFDVAIPVFHKSNFLALSLIGGTAQENDILPKLQFIITITNIITVAIENKRLFRKHLNQEMLRKEMMFAMQMQSRLMPTSFDRTDMIDIHGYYQPKLQVGGDYYDYIVLSEEKVLICIADISGKGVAAALLMSNIQAILRTLLKRTNDISFILKDINDTIIDLMGGDKFASMFLAIYHKSVSRLEYLNAGHNPPLFLNGETDSFNLLDATSSFLGSTSSWPDVQAKSLIIPPQSILVLYTDGLTEIENSEKEYFDIDQIKLVLNNNKHSTALNINGQIVKEAKQFAANEAFLDDLTLLSCKF